MEERVQQRIVEQIVVVHRTTGRERDSGSGHDQSQERIIDRNVDVPVPIQRQVPTIKTVQKTVEVLQVQSLIEWYTCLL